MILFCIKVQVTLYVLCKPEKYPVSEVQVRGANNSVRILQRVSFRNALLTFIKIFL